MKLTKKDTFNIILIIASVLLVAGLGSLFVNLGMEWYSKLNTPTQWIPNIVIPIVWTIIYILFAIVFSLLYKEAFVDKKMLILSIINGALNVLWCLVFFTLNQLLLGNILIILNAFFATFLVIETLRTERWYANLLLIYPLYLAQPF